MLAGDILRLDAAIVDTDSGDAAYSFQIGHEFQINNHGTYLETRLSHFEASSESPFEPGQSLNSESTSAALVIGHAFKRYVETADYVYAELDYRNESSEGFGSSDYGVFRTAFFESFHGDHGDSFSWSVSASAGTELSDSDQSFGLLRGGFGYIFWVPELFETAEMRIESSAQLGSENTPGFELFSFGGANRQRGFAPFEYAGNHGIDLTVELAETFQPFAPSAPILTPYVFTDATYIANSKSRISDGRPERNQLLSAGLGSKVTFFNGFSLDSWVAVPVYDGERSNRSHGVEFYLQGQFTW